MADATVIVGVGLTVTVDVAAVVHPAADEPVMVYEVVLDGEAVTVEPVEALRPVEGDQVYVLAPVAFSAALAPLQIAGEFTVTVGLGLTVMVDVAVAVQPAAEAPVIV